MKVLNLVQTNQKIEELEMQSPLQLSEEQRVKLVKWCGGYEEWIKPLFDLLKNDKDSSEEQADDWLNNKGLWGELWEKIPEREKWKLFNPGLAGEEDWLCRMEIVKGGKLFSPLFELWLQKEKVMEQTVVTESKLTVNEIKALRCLVCASDKLVTRDEIAQAIWSTNWLEKYSDWALDTMIYQLRKKLKKGYEIKTWRNQGYLFSGKSHFNHLKSVPAGIKQAVGVIPTDQYLEYMNDPSKKRIVISDLFKAIQKEGLMKHFESLLSSQDPVRILVINSFSVDNIKAINDWLAVRKNEKDELYFINFDERSLKLHDEYARKYGDDQVWVIYDDIRYSRLKTKFFDLVINDFRLNWNEDHEQNELAMKNIFRVLKTSGWLWLSTLVDARYESPRYGKDQEKAPINRNRPWIAVGEENLIRRAFTVPYYKNLIKRSGFELTAEFDVEEGKKYHPVDPIEDQSIRYRRWLCRKNRG